MNISEMRADYELSQQELTEGYTRQLQAVEKRSEKNFNRLERWIERVTRLYHRVLTPLRGRKRKAQQLRIDAQYELKRMREEKTV